MGIYPHNAAVNALVYLPIGLHLSRRDDPHDDVLTCATEIRKSLENLKDPRLIEVLASELARMQSQSAWNKNSENPQMEGCLMINTTRRWVPGCLGMNRG